MAEAARRLDDRVVSSDSEPLILVDDDDREIGTLDKAACHDGDGVLHRAFSIFVFNRSGELLLQQRSADKRLWPLHWSNTCCSHPRLGETLDDAIHRRLLEELRIRSELRFLYKFRYHARFGDLGAEHELCSVYIGTSDDAPRPNRREIAAWRWIDSAALDHELATAPGRFTPWFRLEWFEVGPSYRSLLAELTDHP